MMNPWALTPSACLLISAHMHLLTILSAYLVCYPIPELTLTKNDRRDQPIILGMSHAIRDLAPYLPERNPGIYFPTTLYIYLNLEGHML